MPSYPVTFGIHALSQYMSQGFRTRFTFTALHRGLWDGLVERDPVDGIPLGSRDAVKNLLGFSSEGS